LEQVGRWPAVAVAAAGRGGETPATVGDVRRPFAWASLTKVLVALSVLVAVEEETVALDEPAGPPGSTVRHLLAHASGLAPDGDRVLAPPGTRRIYSNGGFELLGGELARRAGMAVGEYVAQAVLVPLGMVGTSLPVGASPASGASGPLADLLRLGQELLRPTLVAPTTIEEATTVAFPGLAGVVPGFGRHDPCDWGLGLELRDAKSPHWTGSRNSAVTFGHFGRAGGFLWVDPVADVVCGSLSDRPFGQWAAEVWPRLSDDVLAELSA
jgi:CubicO group peptidase (beta-lactamase class C family)